MSFGYQILGFGSGGVAVTFAIATGGSVPIVTCGDYKIHTFTGPGTFCVSQANAGAGSQIDYIVVAGGSTGASHYGGGGGAGGYREATAAAAPWTGGPNSKIGGGRDVTVQAYPVVIGSAGSPQGGVSSFDCIESAGGGRGGSEGPFAGTPGGSGGGASYGGGSVPAPNGGVGNTPPTVPPQGTDGGLGKPACTGYPGGGGGGAVSGGPYSAAPSGPTAGVGGEGSPTGINPSPSYGTPGPAAGRYFAGGGGGGGGGPGHGQPYTPGAGGSGGGGAGAPNSGSGQSGTANTGGGGGGGRSGAGGGSGIVILRYKFQ